MIFIPYWFIYESLLIPTIVYYTIYPHYRHRDLISQVKVKKLKVAKIIVCIVEYLRLAVDSKDIK